MWSLLLRPAAVARRWLFRLFRRHTQGAKVIAVDSSGAVLLVRNSYGRRHLWVLPGGGLGRGEAPADGAARELREETGLIAEALTRLGQYESTEEGWRDTVHVFVSRVSGELRRDDREIAAARFFALDALPPDTSQATLRRLDEWRGRRPVSGEW